MRTTDPILSQSDPEQLFLTNFSHLRQRVPRYYFMEISLPNPRRQISSPPTWHMSCPSHRSLYRHANNVWSIVLCSHVISCIWDYSNRICGEKDAIYVPFTDDANRDTESWYWILMSLDWGKCCGLISSSTSSSSSSSSSWREPEIKRGCNLFIYSPKMGRY